VAPASNVPPRKSIESSRWMEGVNACVCAAQVYKFRRLGLLKRPTKETC